MVLSAFSAAEPRLSLRELAARTGLPKATVHRLAGSLVACGFMEHGSDGRYALGLSVSVCSPAVDALAAATGETVLLAEADWDTLELTVVASRISPETLSVVPITGQRQTIPPGAPSKALLLGVPPEELDTVLERLSLPALTSKSHTDREQLASEIAAARSVGFAVAEDEYLDGVSGVAVPVMFESGRPRAAIAVVGPSARISSQLEQIGKLAVDLTATLRPQAPVAEAVA